LRKSINKKFVTLKNILSLRFKTLLFMANQILIRTPITVDGRNLAYNSNKEPMYSESYVEARAKNDFVSMNTKLPAHLRHIIVETPEAAPAKKAKAVDNDTAK
jgi:hypothetical protein